MFTRWRLEEVVLILTLDGATQSYSFFGIFQMVHCTDQQATHLHYIKMYQTLIRFCMQEYSAVHYLTAARQFVYCL